MSKVGSRREPKVVVNIRREPAVSSEQTHMWKKFWRKLISEARQERQ